MVFYPDGSKIKINDNNSNKMRLNEMADLKTVRKNKEKIINIIQQEKWFTRL